MLQRIWQVLCESFRPFPFVALVPRKEIIHLGCPIWYCEEARDQQRKIMPALVDKND